MYIMFLSVNRPPSLDDCQKKDDGGNWCFFEFQSHKNLRNPWISSIRTLCRYVFFDVYVIRYLSFPA
ncbi:hypothetical protein Hanom_Chr06g00492831 [Helianthus anomalus]